MPTVDENLEEWGHEYDWDGQGDEWSAEWGGPAMQWYGSVLPRIQRFVPADNILEIACGYGRWTQFLQTLSRHLVAIDLSERCVEFCRTRFGEMSNIEFHVTDGKSLAMIPDHSIDFAFSLDSLVHADAAVMDAYISQLPRILKSDGAAFLHHSNLGAYSRRIAAISRVPKLNGILGLMGIWDRNHHWRDSGVCARVIRGQAEKHGLVCTSQEIVHWGTRRIKNDCFTTLVTKGSRYSTSSPVLINNRFMQEAKYLSKLARLYQQS